jgi:hypothetical protein
MFPIVSCFLSCALVESDDVQANTERDMEGAMMRVLKAHVFPLEQRGMLKELSKHYRISPGISHPALFQHLI